MIKLKQLICEEIKFRDDGGIEISSPDLISDTQWAKIAKIINQKGYNITDAADAKRAISKFLVGKNGILVPDQEFMSDWISAITLALKGAPKRSPSKIDAKKMFEKAKRYFTTTNNFKLAGYILPDGSLLKLSASGYTRDRDHRDITVVFQKAGIVISDDPHESNTAYMLAFMKLGAIRINGEFGDVDIAAPITAQQEKMLGLLFSKNNGQINLDIRDEHYGEASHSYSDGTPPQKILSDIRFFYRNGTLPKQFSFRENRCSRIKLATLIKEGSDLTSIRRIGLIAKRQASDELAKHGLKDAEYFILRIKKLQHKDWIALYRTNSVLSGRPIFWINAELQSMIDAEDPSINIIRVVVDSIIHEWFHAIMDFFRAAVARGKPVRAKFQPRPNQIEEDDAEDFAKWIGDSTWADDSKTDYFSTCISEFNRIWEENG